MPFCGWIGEIVEIERIGSEELSVEWRIRNVLSLSGGSDTYYDSLGFEGWRLSLRPNVTDESRDPPSGWVDLQLRRCGGGMPDNLVVTVAVKGAAGATWKEREVEREFSYRYWFCDWDRFCTRSELSERRSTLMPDDVLTIACAIKTPSAARVKRKSPRKKIFPESKEVVSKTVHGRRKYSRKRITPESRDVINKKMKGKRKSSKMKILENTKARVVNKRMKEKKILARKRKASESKEASVVSKMMKGTKKLSRKRKVDSRT